MKIKRFDNLWAMGLILFGALLIAFYILKIFFPEFIIGVAELPSIVEFGNYVDSHKWAFILYHFTISMIGGYIYCCACCKTIKLNIYQAGILAGFTLLSFVLQEFVYEIYTPFNYVSLVLMPCLMNMISSKKSNILYSTCFCFSVDIMSQALSSIIKNVIVMAPCINSAIMTILLIDIWIWRILLYLFFNYKKGEQNK